jgi:hypothetical protein
MKLLREFILWPNCRNNCAFCHQRKFRNLAEFEKVLSVRLVDEFRRYNKIEQVLFVGGELFDTPFSSELYVAFFDLVEELWRTVELFYVNTNLIYEDLTLVKTFLKICPDFSKLRFTTSYDLEGRFKNDSKDLMLRNCWKLKDLYPDLHIMANTILTPQVCQYPEYMKFDNSHPFDIMFIPCVKVANAPTRNMVLNTLNHLPLEYLQLMLRSHESDQVRDLYAYENGKLENVTSENGPCGHNVNFSMYTSDSNACFICDLKHIVEELW